MRSVCHLHQQPVRCGAGRLGSVNRTIERALRLRSKKFQRYTLYFLISRCPGHGRRGEGRRVGAPTQLAGLTRERGSAGEAGSRACGQGWSAETRSKPEPAVQPQGLGEGNPLSHRFPLPAQVCWAAGREAGGTSGLGSGASLVASVTGSGHTHNLPWSWCLPAPATRCSGVELQRPLKIGWAF